MLVKRLGQQHGRASVAVQVPVECGKAEACSVVVLKRRRTVDHRINAAEMGDHTRQQAANRFLIR